MDESTLLTEFVHLLLTGAFHSGDLLGAPSVRVQVAPPVQEAWSVKEALEQGWAAASLEGGVRGVLAVAVQGDEVPSAPAGDGPGGDSAETRLLTDLSARIGRLLGLPITMTPFPGADLASRGDARDGADTADPAPWMRFSGRVQLQGGAPDVHVGILFSPSLKDGVYRLLSGDSPGDEGPNFADAVEGGLVPRANGGDAGPFGAFPADMPSGGSLHLEAAARHRALRSVQWAQFTFDDVEAEEEAAPVGIDFIGNLPLNLTVELGRAVVNIEDIMRWGPGSILELDRLAGEMLDVLVNGRAIAKGEIVVVEDVFNVKITDIVSPEDRIRKGAESSDGE